MDSAQSGASCRELGALWDLEEAFFAEIESCNIPQARKLRTEKESLDELPCNVDGEFDFKLFGTDRTSCFRVYRRDVYKRLRTECEFMQNTGHSYL